MCSQWNCSKLHYSTHEDQVYHQNSKPLDIYAKLWSAIFYSNCGGGNRFSRKSQAFCNRQITPSLQRSSSCGARLCRKHFWGPAKQRSGSINLTALLRATEPDLQLLKSNLSSILEHGLLQVPQRQPPCHDRQLRWWLRTTL